MCEICEALDAFPQHTAALVGIQTRRHMRQGLIIGVPATPAERGSIVQDALDVRAIAGELCVPFDGLTQVMG